MQFQQIERILEFLCFHNTVNILLKPSCFYSYHCAAFSYLVLYKLLSCKRERKQTNELMLKKYFYIIILFLSFFQRYYIPIIIFPVDQRK